MRALLGAVVLLVLLVLAPAASAQLRPELEWGSHGSGPGQFDTPIDVAAGFDGSIYVADYGNARIQKFDAFGRFLLQWSTRARGDVGPATTAYLAADLLGHVYASTADGEVQKFDERGGRVARWPTPDGLSGGLAVDVAGNVYVTDPNGGRVVKFGPTGTLLTQWGSPGAGPGQFRDPDHAAISGRGNVFVVDHDNARVQEFTPAGSFVSAWTVPPLPPAAIASPEGIAFDTVGNMFVADLAGRVDEFTPAGRLITTYGSPGSSRGQFNRPTGVAVDCRGRLFVADDRNSRIVRYGNPFNVGDCPIRGGGLRVQPIVLDRRRVRFLTLCDLACLINARAVLRVGRTTIKLARTFVLPARSKQRLELQLSGKAPGLVKRALKAGKRVPLTLSVTARTAGGRLTIVRKRTALEP
ncbi:MAG: 6-bladed beta-propeller [Thermoleophilaceae bacterium]